MKIGTWLRTGARLAPLVLSLVPGIPAALVLPVAHAMGEAAKLTESSGLERKDHVMAIVADSLTAAGVSADESAATKEAVSKGIDAVVASTRVIDLHRRSTGTVN